MYSLTEDRAKEWLATSSLPVPRGNAAASPEEASSVSCKKGERRRSWGTELSMSKGGPTTKIKVLCYALGNPVRIVIEEGQRHALHFGSALVEGISGVIIIIGDKGYDANAFVHKFENQGCQADIPSRQTAPQQRDIDPHIYQCRGR